MSLIAACGSNSGGDDKSSSGDVLHVSVLGVQGQYCVIPYGEKLGLYSDHGVKLEHETLQPTQTVGALLASGKLDVGITNAYTVMQLRSEGSPIKAFMGQYQNQASVVVVPASSDITSLADLKGKTVASSASTSGQLFPDLLKKNGVDPKSVKQVTVQTSALAQSLASGRADAITGAKYAEAISAADALGKPVRTLLYSDLGMPGITVVYATSDKLMKADPKKLEGFVAATQAAIEAAKKDPQACIDAQKSVQGTAGLPDDATLLKQLEAALPLLSTPNTKGHPIGWMSPVDWNQSGALAKASLGLDAGFDVSSAYTDQFTEK